MPDRPTDAVVLPPALEILWGRRCPRQPRSARRARRRPDRRRGRRHRERRRAGGGLDGASGQGARLHHDVALPARAEQGRPAPADVERQRTRRSGDWSLEGEHLARATDRRGRSGPARGRSRRTSGSCSCRWRLLRSRPSRWPGSSSGSRRWTRLDVAGLRQDPGARPDQPARTHRRADGLRRAHAARRPAEESGVETDYGTLVRELADPATYPHLTRLVDSEPPPEVPADDPQRGVPLRHRHHPGRHRGACGALSHVTGRWSGRGRGSAPPRG